ncbi:MAG: type VI secretion effector protein (Hcp) [Alphaproteobacteria bacterium RIFOXYD12_FULL_60_8]|nr:MAG: type VI secretion effector protein (Hcp) [Alphaproteobacteria bacterium RIFOXYD12_FULL_60_8]
MDVILMKPGEDIPGESLMKGYEKQIELLSFSHGLSMQVTNDQSNTVRTSGKPNIMEMTITKYMDGASPKLYDYLLRGADIGQVIITTGRNDSGAVLPFMIYTMDEVLVSSISSSGGGGDKPVETLTLNFTRINWEYKQQKTDVSEAGAIAAVWDIKTNQAK